MSTVSTITTKALRSVVYGVNVDKIALESFGYFLIDYVVQGGELIANGTSVIVKEAVISFNDNLYHIQQTALPIYSPSETLYVDFAPAYGFVVGITHPDAPYFPMHQITTDAGLNVLSVTDSRGPTGGLRLNQGIVGDAPLFVYDQITAQSTWNITHNLSKYPNVLVIDSAGSIVIGEVTYHDLNNVTIVFSPSFSGKAYLN